LACNAAASLICSIGNLAAIGTVTLPATIAAAI
jgi:hypothetical protein